MKKNMLLLLCITGQVYGAVASQQNNSMVNGVETVSPTQSKCRVVEGFDPAQTDPVFFGTTGPEPSIPVDLPIAIPDGGPGPMPVAQTGELEVIGNPLAGCRAVEPYGYGLENPPTPVDPMPNTLHPINTGGPDPMPATINPILKPAIQIINMKTFRKKLKSMNCEIIEAIFANKIAPNVRYIAAPQINVTDKVKAVFQTYQELRIKSLMQNAIKNKKLSAKQQELINGGNYWALALFFEVNYSYGTLSLRVRMIPRKTTATKAKVEEYMINMPDNMFKIKQPKAEKESSSTPSAIQLSNLSQTEQILIDVNDNPEAIEEDSAPEL